MPGAELPLTHFGYPFPSSTAEYSHVPTVAPEDQSSAAGAREASRFVKEAYERGHSVLHSFAFQAVMASIVMANAVVLGLETDMPGTEYWDIIEGAFLGAFVVEVMFRLCALGCSLYFSCGNPDFPWNMLDLLIILVGIADASLALAQFYGYFRSMKYLLLMWLLRQLRILRIFRIIRFLKRLSVLAFGVVLAAVALFWVTIIMTFVLFVSSIILVRVFGSPSEEDENGEFLRSHFSTIRNSMGTLFNLMVAPQLEPYQGMMSNGHVLGVIISIFVILGSFGLFALITGVVIENMFEMKRVKVEEDLAEHAQLRLSLERRCKRLYDSMDTNKKGELSRSHLRKLLPKVADMFKSHDVGFSFRDIEGVVDMLDVEGSGLVTKEEFNKFILYMMEGVHPLSIMELRRNMLTEGRQLRDAMKVQMDSVRELQAAIGTSCEQQAVELGGLKQQLAKVLEGLNSSIKDISDSQRRLAHVSNEVSTAKTSILDAITHSSTAAQSESNRHQDLVRKLHAESVNELTTQMQAHAKDFSQSAATNCAKQVTSNVQEAMNTIIRDGLKKLTGDIEKLLGAYTSPEVGVHANSDASSPVVAARGLSTPERLHHSSDSSFQASQDMHPESSKDMNDLLQALMAQTNNLAGQVQTYMTTAHTKEPETVSILIANDVPEETSAHEEVQESQPPAPAHASSGSSPQSPQ